MRRKNNGSAGFFYGYRLPLFFSGGARREGLGSGIPLASPHAARRSRAILKITAGGAEIPFAFRGNRLLSHRKKALSCQGQSEQKQNSYFHESRLHESLLPSFHAAQRFLLLFPSTALRPKEPPGTLIMTCREVNKSIQFLSSPQASIFLPMYGFLISFSFCNQLALTIGQ